MLIVTKNNIEYSTQHCRTSCRWSSGTCILQFILIQMGYHFLLKYSRWPLDWFDQRLFQNQQLVGTWKTNKISLRVLICSIQDLFDLILWNPSFRTICLFRTNKGFQGVLNFIVDKLLSCPRTQSSPRKDIIIFHIISQCFWQVCKNMV